MLLTAFNTHPKCKSANGKTDLVPVQSLQWHDSFGCFRQTSIYVNEMFYKQAAIYVSMLIENASSFASFLRGISIFGKNYILFPFSSKLLRLFSHSVNLFLRYFSQLHSYCVRFATLPFLRFLLMYSEYLFVCSYV